MTNAGNAGHYFLRYQYTRGTNHYDNSTTKPENQFALPQL